MPRKHYESNKTLVQIWLGRIIAGVGIVLLAIVLYHFGRGVYLLFAHPDTDGPLVWSSKDGIGYSEKGGERTGVYKLPGRAGEAISFPHFLCTKDTLAYYSPTDRSVCLVTSNGKTWVSVEAQIPQDAIVKELRPSRHGVLVVAFTKGSGEDDDTSQKVVGVADVDIGTASVRALDVPADIRINPNTGDSVRFASNGFSRSTGGSNSVNAETIGWDWSYTGDALIANSGKTISIYGSKEGKGNWGLGPMYFIRGIDCNTAPDEIWIEAVKPFNAGYLMLSYDYAGSMKKLQLKDDVGIKPPFVKATPDVLNLVHAASQGVIE